MRRQTVTTETPTKRPAGDPHRTGRASDHRAALVGRGFAEQSAMMAPGGALDGTIQAKIDPAQQCGPGEQPHGDPTPFNWTIDYRRRGLGEGRFDKGKKQRVHVEAKFDWALMNRSHKSPKVTTLVGEVTTVTKEGRRVVDTYGPEELEFTVAENAARFDKEVSLAKRFALKRTKVKSKGPQRQPEAEVESCS